MTEAEITLKECTHDSWLDRKVFGWRWFWNASLRGHGSECGFARTEAKARQRAEKAARKLATLAPEPETIYQYDVDGEALADTGKVQPTPGHMEKLRRDLGWPIGPLPDPDEDGRVLLRTLDDGARMYAAFYDWGPGHRHHWLAEFDQPADQETR